jgi:hypothetical protein
VDKKLANRFADPAGVTWVGCVPTWAYGVPVRFLARDRLAEPTPFWKQFPDAAFTLVKMPEQSGTQGGALQAGAPEEYRLGAFELPANSGSSEA